MWKSRRDGTTSTLARPRRGQTTVTAGLDLRIATTSHTRTTPTGSHGREKANPSMCDLYEVGSILGGVHPQVKTCGYANATSPRSVGHLPRRDSALQRGSAALHAPKGQYLLAQGSALGDGAPLKVAPCKGKIIIPCRF